MKKDVFSEKRQRMTSKNLEAVLFLQQNEDLWDASVVAEARRLHYEEEDDEEDPRTQKKIIF